jgi:hypothetical protein
MAVTPTDRPAPAVENATVIASDFIEAFGAFDMTISYLADDADLSGGGLEGTGEFRLLLRFNEATGFKRVLDSCV